MNNFNSKYIKTASSQVKLLYPRTKMQTGEKILSNYVPNVGLVEELKRTNEIYIYLYLKPLGDSILFLSIVQATLDYIKIIKPKAKPTLYAQRDIKDLLKHCTLFKDAIYIKDVERKFRSASKKRSVLLITDGDPFKFSGFGQVFNTENYIYPKFVETEGGKIVKEYKSRPARYYLTFEREVGTVLSSDPNLSMPTFELPFSSKIDKAVKKKEQLFQSKCIYISLIALANLKERQKQFGVLRYLEVAREIQKRFPDNIIRFVLFTHKDEENESWNKLEKSINGDNGLDIAIYDCKNLEETGYILARMNLHIGNDTGISHLAAVSRKSNQAKLIPTIIVYSRHDFGKWCTGRDNVFPVYTKLAKYLARNNKSISRDTIDLKFWGVEEYASNIPVKKVVDVALWHLKKIWAKN